MSPTTANKVTGPCIIPGGDLDELSDRLFDAARAYHAAYMREIGRAPVVWIYNRDTGEAIVWTRGEYAREIMGRVDEINRSGDPWPDVSPNPARP